jgi:hypothetical protein
MALAGLPFLLLVAGRAGSAEAEGAREVEGVGSVEFVKEREGAGDWRAERVRVAAVFFGVPVRPIREAEVTRSTEREWLERGQRTRTLSRRPGLSLLRLLRDKIKRGYTACTVILRSYSSIRSGAGAAPISIWLRTRALNLDPSRESSSKVPCSATTP